MKKITDVMAMFMLVLMVFMAVPLAHADGNGTTADSQTTIDANQTTVDAQTALEVQDFQTGNGGQMRMLQLEYQLERNVLFGNAIIARIQANTNDTNATNLTVNLETIVAQLDQLSVEANATINANETGNETVAQFLAIKSEATSLIAQFRQEADSILKQNDITNLKANFDDLDKQNFKELKDSIKEKQLEVTKERVQNLLDKLNQKDDNLLAQISSDNLTGDQIKAKLKAHFDSLSNDKKESIAKILNEDNVKERVARAKAIADVINDVRKIRDDNRQIAVNKLIAMGKANLANNIEARWQMHGMMGNESWNNTNQSRYTGMMDRLGADVRARMDMMNDSNQSWNNTNQSYRNGLIDRIGVNVRAHIGVMDDSNQSGNETNSSEDAQ